MKSKILLLPCFLATTMLLGSCGGAYKEETKIPFSALSAKGTHMVNVEGNAVQLIGTNLGGWLVFEEWFCPVYDNKDTDPLASGSEIYDTLLSRFSAEQVDTLLSTYQQNWITEDDLDYIKSLGINCLRVPFWYRNLQNSDGSWKLKDNGEIDFGLLDWVVEQCDKREIYVILDLHGAPGYQSVAHHSGANNSCHLYDDTPEGDEYRKRTAEIWKKTAEHYKNCRTVAAFDLLNEPYCDMELDEKAYKNINSVYDLLYKAVREVNSSTTVIMEGIWAIDCLPDPAEMDWENVMYETHFYDYDKSTIRSNAKQLSTYSNKYDIPVYVGEFESGELEAYAIELYSSVGANLTTWTYKGAADSERWFLRFDADAEKANIVTDSYEDILRKWGEPIRTNPTQENSSFSTSETIKQALTDALRRAN